MCDLAREYFAGRACPWRLTPRFGGERGNGFAGGKHPGCGRPRRLSRALLGLAVLGKARPRKCTAGLVMSPKCEAIANASPRRVRARLRKGQRTSVEPPVRASSARGSVLASDNGCSCATRSGKILGGVDRRLRERGASFVLSPPLSCKQTAGRHRKVRSPRRTVRRARGV